MEQIAILVLILSISLSLSYIIIHWTRYLFSDWSKAYSEFSIFSTRDVITADYTIIMYRTLKVTGNHVMYDRNAWFLRVIMSSSRVLRCLPSVKKQKHGFNFFSVQCIIKQLLDSVFVISRIIEVSVRVISLSLRLRLRLLRLISESPPSTSIILDITKTSSNNCLLSSCLA